MCLTLQNSRCIYFIAALASLLLSCWMSFRPSIINPDAVCYLESASMIGTDGLQAAMQLCGQAHWPFYSGLIFQFVTLTSVSFLSAAFILNALFSLISVVSFIAIIQFFKNSSRMLWLAAFVVLFAHHFDGVRQYIIRDHGFWAFYLVSVLCALHYFRFQQWRYALAWSVSIIVATLFRIEGIFFLLAMPVAGLLSAHRMKSFLQLNMLSLIGAVCIGVWVLLHPEYSLGRLSEVRFQLLQGLSVVREHFQVNANNLARHVLSVYSARDASMILASMLSIWYVMSVVVNLSLIYTVLVVYAWFKKLLVLDKPSRLVIWSYILINVIITFAFLAQNMFLSKRYLIALSLIFMLWVPFALDYLFQKKHKKLFYLIILFIFIFSFGGIVDFGHSKIYIRDSGDWLAKNIPKNAKLYSNDYLVMYYSQHFGKDIFATWDGQSQKDLPKNFQQYDYLALRFNKKEVNKINLIPVKKFSNTRGDQVNIYKISHPGGSL